MTGAAMRLSTHRLPVFLILIAMTAASAAEPPTYQRPPDPIPRMVGAAPPPTLSLAPDRREILLMEREGLPPIARLAEPELRLAGLRFHPSTNGPSRELHGLGLALVEVETGARRDVELPGDFRIGDTAWSPNSEHVAITRATDNGIELWLLERESGKARRLLGPVLNSLFGDPIQWDFDSRSLYVRRIPEGRGEPPAPPVVPTGPVIQESSGVAEPARTYQDLLANAHDEAVFEHYATSEWVRIAVDDGKIEPVLPAGLWSSLDPSPDGSHLHATRYNRPFSYQTPISTFGREIAVFDRQGRRVNQIENRTEVTPPRIGRDMVNPGPREVQWRADAPATLIWAEAADGGDARSTSALRDRVLMLAAPFQGEPTVLAELDQRFASATWGKDGSALVRSTWQTSSRTKTWLARPDQPGSAPGIVFDHSLEDRYAHPGIPLTEPAGNGHRLLIFDDDGGIFLAGEGASPAGNYPFLDRLDLASGKAARLWQCADPFYESVVALLSRDGRRFITRRESAAEPPNYLVRDLAADRATPLTEIPDPVPELAGLRRQLITYTRADGVPLSAALLTPPGYDQGRDGPLPLLLWAYPREFRDPAAAGQVADSPNRFSRPIGASHLYLLTQGYAILDGPAMPIIGEGDTEPNDSYIEQLVASAAAAVDKAVEMGVAERGRIAVGGHSYGAFMTANLLAHSDLFRAGIARSGAYNRTLTPFGFQAEPRSFWEAPAIYQRMSPFAHANQIKAPVLLIHGIEDDNSGTFPMQSERLYQAIAGHGGTVRLVMLPHESHGYQAKESVLHALAEMTAWLDKHVKAVDP
jgi:dipeptidyl aminopeptidase/acylaminoacyl peptidase